jgi:hypothetical protein
MARTLALVAPGARSGHLFSCRKFSRAQRRSLQRRSLTPSVRILSAKTCPRHRNRRLQPWLTRFNARYNARVMEARALECAARSLRRFQPPAWVDPSPLPASQLPSLNARIAHHIFALRELLQPALALPSTLAVSGALVFSSQHVPLHLQPGFATQPTTSNAATFRGAAHGYQPCPIF